MKLLTNFMVLIEICVFVQCNPSPAKSKKTKCITEPTTFKKIEKLIKDCEDDVKIQIIQEAFEVVHDSHWHRSKRYVEFEYMHSHPTTLAHEDRRLAGCLMHCIYRKNHATDVLGWPTLDGLVDLYSDGVNEHGYFMATLRSVDHCLKGASLKYDVQRSSTSEHTKQCDISFDVFDCISDKIIEYCSDQHNHTELHDRDHH